ncbi:MAG: hypothetical protein Fur0010_12450 [Bdellovibrio sp.]
MSSQIEELFSKMNCPSSLEIQFDNGKIQKECHSEVKSISMHLTTKKKLSDVELKQMLKDSLTLIKSTYDPSPSPYFAIVSQNIQCPKNFLPQFIINDSSYLMVEEFANERKTLRVCQEEQKKYHVLTHYFGCKDTFYKAMFFIAIGEEIPSAIKNRIECL